MKRIALLAATTVLLAGCGIQKDATYENATKLREAVIASGVECPGDSVKHDDKNGEDFVKCSSSLALAVYDTDEDAGMAQVIYGLGKNAYLTGTRWLIQAEDESTLVTLKEKLGGSLAVP